MREPADPITHQDQPLNTQDTGYATLSVSIFNKFGYALPIYAAKQGTIPKTRTNKANLDECSKPTDFVYPSIDRIKSSTA